jgi:DNA-binding GntR family transcriptional regulator
LFRRWDGGQSFPVCEIPAFSLSMALRSPRTVHFDRGQRRQVIVESLIADVLQGRLRAGQHLRTQDLATRHGVSHTPIREALIALAGVGVIDLLPNRGAIVRKVTAADVREVCQVRRVLECEATRRACGRIESAKLKSLAAALARLTRDIGHSKPSFIERARTLDDRLRDLIAASCGNRFLAQELGRLKILFRAFRDMAWAYEESHRDYRRLVGEAQEHLAIVDALTSGDSREAARAMARHIRSGFKYWSRALPTRDVSLLNNEPLTRDAGNNGTSDKHRKNGR